MENKAYDDFLLGETQNKYIQSQNESFGDCVHQFYPKQGFDVNNFHRLWFPQCVHGLTCWLLIFHHGWWLDEWHIVQWIKFASPNNANLKPLAATISIFDASPSRVGGWWDALQMPFKPLRRGGRSMWPTFVSGALYHQSWWWWCKRWRSKRSKQIKSGFMFLHF